MDSLKDKPCLPMAQCTADAAIPPSPLLAWLIVNRVML